ncbi:MAG TPA: hypothetical protein VLA66_08485, partial [Thermoanaerobaculia bacterium]|nr:hypothetical protein [Thermoanaerobaculia bacterium]
MSAVAPRLAAALGRIRPEEGLAAAFAAVVALLLAVRGLPLTLAGMLREYGTYLGLLTAFSLVPWAVARGLARWRGAPPRPGAVRDLGTLARSLPAVLVVLVAYTNLKSRLFVLHPTLYDAELARLDAIVHFGGGDFLGWILSTTADPRFMHGLALVYFYAWLGLALPFS